MGDGFSVDYDSLQRLGGQLGDLADEIDGIQDDLEPYEAALGDPPRDGRDLPEEVSKFGSNWKKKRGKIVGRLRELSEMADGASEAYRTTDEGMADQLSG